MTNDNRKSDPESPVRISIAPPGQNDPIAAALKRIHDAVVEEDVPDAFLDIVAQIEAKLETRQ